MLDKVTLPALDMSFVPTNAVGLIKQQINSKIVLPLEGSPVLPGKSVSLSTCIMISIHRRNSVRSCYSDDY